MTNPVTSFFVGRAMAGGDDVDNSEINAARTNLQIADNKADAAHETSLALAMALRQEQNEVVDWRMYANRLNVHLAARKMSEATLLDALKEANINHPMATREGFEQLFQKALSEQYGLLDAANADEEISVFEQKSLEEVGKERSDVK